MLNEGGSPGPPLIIGSAIMWISLNKTSETGDPKQSPLSFTIKAAALAVVDEPAEKAPAKTRAKKA